MDPINAAMDDQNIKDPRPSTKANGFFDLPQELRDLIYRELWAGKTFTGKHIDDKIRFMYTLSFEKITPGGLIVRPYPERRRPARPLSDSQPRLPRWLLASKSFLAEAISEFTRSGTVAISFAGLSLTAKYKKSNPNTILGPFSVRNMQVEPNSLVDASIDASIAEALFSKYDCRDLEELFPKLVGSPVKSLHIYLRTNSYVSGDVQHSISLYPLQGVHILSGHLERVEIELFENVNGILARSSFDASLLSEIAVLENGLDQMKLQTSKDSTLRKGKQGFCWSFVFTKMHGGS